MASSPCQPWGLQCNLSQPQFLSLRLSSLLQLPDIPQLPLRPRRGSRFLSSYLATVRSSFLAQGPGCSLSSGRPSDQRIRPPTSRSYKACLLFTSYDVCKPYLYVRISVMRFTVMTLFNDRKSISLRIDIKLMRYIYKTQ